MTKTLVLGVAISLLTVACSSDPSAKARRYVENGDRFLEEGRPDSAIIEFRNATREQPGAVEVRRKLGDALLQAGRTADAYREYAAAERTVGGVVLPFGESELRAAVTQHPQSAAPRMALAEALLSSEQPDEAMEQLTAAVALEPTNELANRSLAALLVSQGRLDEAERCLRMAAAQRPQRYRSQLALADFLVDAGRYEDARRALDPPAGRQIDPQLTIDSGLRLAAVDYAEGDVDAANQRLTLLIAEHPSAEAWTLQADFRLREGKLDEAMAAVKSALALDAQFEPATKLASVVRQREVWRKAN